MSPKFGLALLLLCFVLLGLSDAQRQEQQKIHQRRGQYIQGRKDAGNAARRGPVRASGRSTTDVLPDAAPSCAVDTNSPAASDADVAGPEIPSGTSKNPLATRNPDRFKKRS